MHMHTEIGRNRTGAQMSPILTAEMQDGEDEAPILPGADGQPERADLAMKLDYARDADALGSVPPPATLTGVVKSGVDMVTGKRPQVLIDKLGERLAFERGGVRLYDALLVKCASADGAGLGAEEIQTLERFRQEEAAHFALVADVLRDLGGDPTAQTPCADLVGVESAGLVQAMNDPRTNLLQGLHVMLDAELIDNASWELLIELAEAAGHKAQAERLQTGLQQEAVHLQTLRSLVARLTLEDAGALPATR
ncbi:ferritin Dps family protein [Ideonella sp.]|uniref:ferritin Dps family protein n=1 Tax=Ideonella sp. TaxID=1929293 RepID=UPI0035B49563